eukprot:13625606-Heterocapsa_arctica.AAC.1
MATAIAARDAQNDESADEARETARESNRMLAALGPPGTGKTTVVNACIRRWHRKGARILFALPTG